MRISCLELFLVIAGFLAVGTLLAIVAWGPIGSDEVGYMQVSLNNTKEPFIVNRYFHVYLQKMFIMLAPSPLVGARVYWAFLITLTGFLIYLYARLLSITNNIIHSMVAVALFFFILFHCRNLWCTFRRFHCHGHGDAGYDALYLCDPASAEPKMAVGRAGFHVLPGF